MNIKKGAILIPVAIAGNVMMNTCAKMSSPAHGPIEMVFYRGLIALSLVIPYMVLTQPMPVFNGQFESSEGVKHDTADHRYGDFYNGSPAFRHLLVSGRN